MPVDKSILILNRGFGHFCTLKELMEGQRVVCVRLFCDGSYFTKKAFDIEEEDFIAEWVPTKKRAEK